MRSKLFILISLLILTSNSIVKADVSTSDTTFKPVIEPIQKISGPIQGGTSEEVSTYQRIPMQDAIDYAMNHNLAIQNARLNIPIGKNNIKVANRLQNPYIQYFFNAGKAATDNPNNVGLILPFEIAKRAPRKRLAKSNLELTKGSVLLQELYLRLDVRQAYVDLVSAKTALKILDDQRKLLAELVTVAQRKYDVGAAPQMEVIQAKMTLNQLLIQLNSAKTDVYLARYKFNILLQTKNLDTAEDYLPDKTGFGQLLTPNSSEKIPEFDKIADIAMKKRLDIKNALQSVDVAQKNLVTVVRQRVPDIEIGGGPLVVPSQWATSEQTSTGYYVGGNITNIPLFYMYNPEIKNAKIQIEQKQLDYENTKHQALLNLHSAYDAFVTAQSNLNHYNDVLLSETNQFLHMARRSYDIGKTSITDYIFIEQSYKNIMMGYTNALSSYYDAWIGLIKEVNDEDLKLNG